MKVHLIKEKTVTDFMNKHAGSMAAFENWLEKLEQADWNKPSDIVASFNCADLLGNGSDRAVFNIGGNNYLLIGEYLFGRSFVHLFVCWIGTHSEYDKLCRKNEQYTVSKY